MIARFIAAAVVCVWAAAAARGAGAIDFQKLIDDAAARGGGRVVVPAGVHETKALRLRSRVELHLEKGAVLRGSLRRADYTPFPVSVCPVRPESSGLALLFAWDETDIAVTGEGVIDGRGPEFFPNRDMRPSFRGFWPKPALPRPRLLQLVRCRNVRLQRVTFKDSAGWTMFVRQCENVAVDGITVDCDQRVINSDGIDFDSCRRVRVGNCRFKTGDDCLVLRAMREKQTERAVCEDIVISNCVLNSACQTIRISAPSDDTVRHALFRNIRATGRNGIFFDYPARYVRAWDEGYTSVSNIVFDGYTGTHSGSAVQIIAEPGVKIRGVRDVTFRNFSVASAQPLKFVTTAESPVENVRFDNVTVNGQRRRDGRVAPQVRPSRPFRRSLDWSWETMSESDFRVRDPFVLVDGGHYYLYESRARHGRNGVAVRRSADLVTWTAPEQVMTLPADIRANAVWAPEVHRAGGKYWLFATVTEERGVRRMDGPPQTVPRGTWIFRANSPMGPFTAVKNEPVPPPAHQTLDGTLYVEDGKPYMVYCHEWCQLGNGTIEYAPLAPDFASFLAPPKKLLDARSAMKGAGPVTDGPFFLRSRTSARLYLIWSNFIKGCGYTVLVRSSASGKIGGPWTTDEILFAKDGGHGMIFRGLDGRLRLSFHQPNSSPNERLRLYFLDEDGTRLTITGPCQ
jgi:hypothetical protein